MGNTTSIPQSFSKSSENKDNNAIQSLTFKSNGSPSLSLSSSSCSLSSSSFSLISIPQSIQQDDDYDQDSVNEQQVILFTPPLTTEEQKGQEAAVVISLPLVNSKKTFKKDVKDMFSESLVAHWRLQKISAWKKRYSNPESFYFHHVNPDEGQRHGKWNEIEHQLFMKRYNTWISNGWELKTSWGLFSRSIPHRSGIQCKNYFYQLTQQKDACVVAWIKKDCKDKHFVAGTAPPPTELSPTWYANEFKELETNVDQWIVQYNREGSTSLNR